jgi:hypothetical protein
LSSLVQPAKPDSDCQTRQGKSACIRRSHLPERGGGRTPIGTVINAPASIILGKDGWSRGITCPPLLVAMHPMYVRAVGVPPFFSAHRPTA